jgi:WD40 repeat protein
MKYLIKIIVLLVVNNLIFRCHLIAQEIKNQEKYLLNVLSKNYEGVKNRDKQKYYIFNSSMFNNPDPKIGHNLNADPYLGWEGHIGYPTFCVAIDKPNSKIATGGYDGTIRLWDTKLGDSIGIFYGHNLPITSICFTPDGSKLASASRDAKIKIWDVKNGNLIRTLISQSSITPIDFSPDGTKLICGSISVPIEVWDIGSGAILQRLQSTSAALSVAYSPDGSKVVSGHSNNSIMIWNMSNGTLAKTISGHGQKIASSGTDHSVKLWNSSTGTLLGTFQRHTDIVNSICFSPI